MVGKSIITAILVTVGGLVPPSPVSGVGSESRFDGKHELIDSYQLEIPPDAKCPQFWQTALNVGWAPWNLSTLDYLMWRESRCMRTAHNLDDPMGGSRGLVQINGSWTGWLKRAGIINDEADLFRPQRNLRAALAIYNYADGRYGMGWNPWNL